jgi:hypothetical protein
MNKKCGFTGVVVKKAGSVGALNRLPVRTICCGRVVQKEHVQKRAELDSAAASERLKVHTVQATIYVHAPRGRGLL